MNRIKVYLDHHSYSSVWLSREELESLYLLLKFKIITQDQFYRIYCIHSENPISPRAFLNRMRKFDSINLITRYHVREKKSAIGYRYLSIGNFGLEMLEQEGFLIGSGISVQNHRPKRSANRDHDLASREMIVHFMEFWNRYGDSTPFTFHEPSYYKKRAGNQAISSVVPDGLFSVGDQFIALELDTGNESQGEILEKIENYIFTTDSFPDERPMILIAVDDSSFHSYMQVNKGSRDRRVANIKKTLSSSSVIKKSTISVYVGSMTRAKKIGERFLTHGTRQFNTDTFKHRVEVSLGFMNIHDYLEYSLERYEEEETVVDKMVECPTGIYKVLSRRRKRLEEYMGVFAIEEGDIHGYNIIENAHHETISTGVLDLPMRSLIIYENEDEAVYDVHGKHYPHVLYSYLPSLDGSTDPVFYRSSSPYKKVKTSFEKGVMIE